MALPPESSDSPLSGPALLAEALRLYRAAEEYGEHHETTLHVDALKAFLAFVEERRSGLSSDSTSVAGWLDEAAMDFYRLGEADLSGRAIETGLALTPNAPTLLHHKALVLLSQNRNLPYVLPLLEQALLAKPDDKAIWATKGDALQLLERPQEAADAYLRAQSLDPNSTQYAERALRVAPSYPPALRTMVERARARGGAQEALTACETLLKESPADFELLLTRAELLAALARSEEALAAAQSLPSVPEASVANVSTLKARLYFSLQRPTDGATEARALLARSGTLDPASLGELAELAGAVNEKELALDLRVRLWEERPDDRANTVAARTLAHERGSHEIALKISQGAVDRSPPEPEAMRWLAEDQIAAGRVDDAMRSYRALADAAPSDPSATRTALAAAQKADRPAAVEEFAGRLARVLPDDIPALEQLAGAIARQGRGADALPIYDRLRGLRPSDVAYLIAEKQILVGLQRTQELPRIYDEIFALDPTRSDVALERGELYLRRAEAEPDGSPGRSAAARIAIVSFERATSNPEQRAKALLGLGRAARLAQMLDRAVSSYTELFQLPGDEPRADAHKELGHVYREMGRFRDAEAEYSLALARGLQDTDLLWGEVDSLTRIHQDASALRYIGILLVRDPNNPVYLRCKGQLQLSTGERAEAITTLRQAVQAAGSDPHAYFDVAEALRAHGANPEAIEYFEQGLQRDPKNRRGRLAIAETLVHSSRFAEAMPYLDGVLHDDPNELRAWRARADACRALRRPSDLAYSLRAILLLDPGNTAALLEKAQIDRAQGRPQDAFEALRQVLDGHGPEAHDAKLWLDQADLATELGRTDETTHAFDEAQKLDPALAPEIATRRARLRLRAGRPDLALEALDQLPKDPATPPVTPVAILRAEILLALERPADAEAVYREIQSRDPGNTVASLGVARTLLEQGKPAEARDALRADLAKIPPTAEAYLTLAEAESALGNLGEAVTVLREATKKVPEAVALWGRLGEVEIRQERWPAAADALAHAMALDQGNPELPLRAGFVAEKLGHDHEALALYEHAAQIAPGNKYAWSSQGLVLLKLGRPEESIASFERAIGSDVDFEAAKEGKKAAQQKLRETLVERHGREALLLEARLNRPINRNDLFVTLHVPYDLLDPVLAALGRVPKIDVERLNDAERQELESASLEIVTNALQHRPPGIERRGLTLADVAVLSPASVTLNDLQRRFGYVQGVLALDLKPGNLSLTPELEELARKGLTLPEADRTLFQIAHRLGVGLYKARIIKTIESAGGTTRTPGPAVDLGRYSPEFQTPSATEGAPPAAGGFFPED
ncbi:MAG: tetratricopeptide repeat protein, partial [Thermoplasmata archaeon]|nr:tetratricopeptide repeat protein [Thermoplasmata archaeon]